MLGEGWSLPARQQTLLEHSHRVLVAGRIVEGGDRVELELDPAGMALELIEYRIDVPDQELPRGVEFVRFALCHEGESRICRAPSTGRPGAAMRRWKSRGLDPTWPGTKWNKNQHDDPV